MLTWTDKRTRPKDTVWTVTCNGQEIGHAGKHVDGRKLGNSTRTEAIGLHWFWQLGTSNLIFWAEDEESVRSELEEAMADDQLLMGNRLQALFVGLMWAESLVHDYDGPPGTAHRVLPKSFPGPRTKRAIGS